MRDTSTINASRSTSAVANTLIRLVHFENKINASSNAFVCSLPKMSKQKVSCYTMTLNPMNNNILAVGCRDQWVRLYDRRTLSVGDGMGAKPFLLLTQHSLLHKPTKNSSRFADSEGVTGLAWR